MKRNRIILATMFLAIMTLAVNMTSCEHKEEIDSKAKLLTAKCPIILANNDGKVKIVSVSSVNTGDMKVVNITLNADDYTKDDNSVDANVNSLAGLSRSLSNGIVGTLSDCDPAMAELLNLAKEDKYDLDVTIVGTNSGDTNSLHNGEITSYDVGE